MLGNQSTLIGRLRVRAGTPDPLLTQLRIGRLLGPIDLHPPGLSASAVLVVRALRDPLPHSLRLDNDDLAPPGWQQALRSNLDRLASSAVRPARTTVPANAEAVVFADQSEVLACLASDWCQGNVRSRWWWRHLIQQEFSWSTVKELWQRTPQYVPAALEQLALLKQAVSFVRNFSDPELHELWSAVARTFALTSLIPLLEETISTPAFTKTTAAEQERLAATGDVKRQPSAAIRPPWAHAVPEVAGASLRPPQEFLLGVTLMLQRAPAKVRGANFQIEVQRWATATAHMREQNFPIRAELAERPPTKQSAHEVSAERSTVASERPRAGKSISLATGERNALPRHQPEIREAPVEPQTGFDAAEPITVETVRDALLEQRRNPKRQTDMKAPISTSETSVVASVTESIVAPNPEPIEVNSDLPLSLEPVESAPQQLTDAAFEPVTAAAEVKRDEPLADAALSEEACPAFHVAEIETTGEWIETELGGLFYLINLALFLGLYGDFTSPDEPGLQLSIWHFIKLLGKNLLGEMSEDDPAWDLLTRLAQPDDENEGDSSFEPEDEWRLPWEWLQPFAAETSRPWLWSASADRLRLYHPDGFAVLDLRRAGSEASPESPATQLARELEAYANFDFRVSGLSLIEQPSLSPELETRNSKLEIWLARLLPYVRARLRKALGLAETVEPGPLLCRQRARVCATPTHVDLYFRLVDLAIETRRAGLDRDPGWVPSAGRFIAFHFE